MKAVTLDSADEIYACCDAQLVGTRVVRHEGVKVFAMGLQRLERRLGDVDGESYWTSLLKPLRRFRYRIASIPLQLCSPLCVPDDLARALHDIAPRCRHVYPEYSDEVMRIAEAAAPLMNSTEAPLLDALRSVLAEDDMEGEKGILIRGQAATLLRNELRRLLGNPRLEVVTPSATLARNILGHLLPIGPLSWFPPYIRTAPRSRRLTCIRYDWLADRQALQPSFTSSPETMFRRPHAGNSESPSETIQDPEFAMSPSDIAPAVNWGALNSDNLLRESCQEDSEEVSARLLLLSANMAVYVDASSDAKSQVIEFSGGHRIARVLNEELEPAMYILLRTGGGGDLIAPVADAILGARAQDVRSIQKRWKSALGALVREKGELAVLRSLTELGCKRASRLNLRNWMNDKSIRPEFDDDFLSILVLCGLDSDDKIFMTNARLLDRVHRIAGFKIRRMLLNRVGKGDLSQLLSEGSMDFELPGAAGGSFTAYRIEEISPESFMVPVTYLNHPFEAESHYG